MHALIAAGTWGLATCKQQHQAVNCLLSGNNFPQPCAVATCLWLAVLAVSCWLTHIHARNACTLLGLQLLQVTM